ncbi:MAG: DUF1501 domain-containing protein [Planctomycetota bacterium]|nr:DUF1501 domain-containing protein [Planctomycetota bacterium]
MDHHDCSCGPTLTRRGFVGLTLGGALGWLAGGGSARAFADEAARAAAPAGFGQAKRCIVLWLNGGPSHLDTFDPKPGHANAGPVKAIDTRAPGVQLSEYLPQLAERMDRVSLVRSMASREGNHERARYFLHTGYVPSGTVAHPDLGALVCQRTADADFDMPSYIAINGATPGPGILGVAQAPFFVPDPLKPIENLAHAQGIDAGRFDRRERLRRALGRAFEETRGGPETRGHEAVYGKAQTLMRSPRLAAFDLSQEPAALREAYGRGKFGQGVLMARRLIEAGVKVVEVQLSGWDTHQDNFTRVKNLCGQLDPAFATLIKDLADRDLLDSTLVVCMGEFGRTPRINANEGRDHFARAWSLALAGGGVRGGRVVGQTTPDGAQVAERPVTVPELMSTILHTVGVGPDELNYSREGRPIYVVDGGAKPLGQLFA